MNRNAQLIKLSSNDGMDKNMRVRKLRSLETNREKAPLSLE